jgi:hypothetical protein
MSYSFDTAGPSTQLQIVSRQAHEKEFHRWMTIKLKSQASNEIGLGIRFGSVVRSIAVKTLSIQLFV